MNRSPAFEITSKRRKGYPSETNVKKGVRVVHGEKELTEKLGRRDLCPCGSGRRFKNCCLESGRYDGSLRGHFFQRKGLNADIDTSSMKYVLNE